MGSRANSTLFYGIYWDENNYVFKDEEGEFDSDDVQEEVELINENFEFETIYCHEHSYCLFLKGTHFSGDWDDPTIIDPNMLVGIQNPVVIEQFKEICDKLGMNHLEPKIQMISHYW